jgi:hypothetical protein
MIKGIGMLTLALMLSAGMGLIQETLYKTHGKYPDEALYYNVKPIKLLILSIEILRIYILN